MSSIEQLCPRPLLAKTNQYRLNRNYKKSSSRFFKSPYPILQWNTACHAQRSTSVLWEGQNYISRRLNLFRPSSESLEQLAKTCDPVTFGRNHENIHDESYRKAGKLGTDAFSIGLDIINSQLVEAVRSNLLRGLLAQRPIRAELYNLNVYGCL